MPTFSMRLRTRALLFLIALLAAYPAIRIKAAFQFPPDLQEATEEQQRGSIELKAELSLQDKLRVGRQRYEERQALRRSLAAGMRANLERRRAFITNQAPSEVSPHKPGENNSPTLLLVVAVLLAGGFLLRPRQEL